MSGIRYEFEGGIPFNNNLQLLYVTSEKYGVDWHSIPHTHSCTELFYCVKGVGQFIINNQTFPVGSNDLIIVNSDVEHTEVSYPSNPLEYIVLGVSNINFNLDNTQNKGWVALNFNSYSDDIIGILKELLHELRHKRRNYERIVSLLTEIIFVKITRHAESTFENTGKNKSNKECDLVKRHIDLHFHDKITLDDLADLAHLNKYYLSHRFTEVYGMSPINYLFETRIKESKYLLSQTNYSVSQISQILGFSSPSYFSQQFKKKVGSSPREFRK